VRGLFTLAVGGLVAIAAGVVGLQLSRHRTSWGRAIEAVSERLVGITAVPIGGVIGPTLSVAMGAVGIALALSAGWMLVRPVLRVSDPGTAMTLPDARRYVANYGGDTLSYFALRSDKEHVRVGDTLVAYAVHSGVCLVSPDPIGPVADREAAWNAFRVHVTRHGWSLAVLGASDAWLPIYLASGMYQRYIGDEAIVDCQSFRLEGGPMKGLRQAVNRVAKYGYTIEFLDPATVDLAMANRLRLLMTESRQGQVERGFSMTLSRIFDADDVGLLLAVAFGPDGAPVAFCQFVPAFDIDGYSLDLMRRTEAGDHPNGLTDFILVRTIEHLREQGKRGLSLNFATMRAVLAGEMGDGFGQRMERRVVEKLSASMQIESLWRYNAKFFPEWRRRYLVYDAPEHLVSIGMAVATAEQFWELPVVGRLISTGVPERA
jgi:lysylphosphatidylglycerol synthetase-like protein (DUF2156 family)